MYNHERYIRVKGTGHVEMAADIIHLHMVITNEHYSYNKVTIVAQQLLGILREALAQANLYADDLKASDFHVYQRKTRLDDDVDDDECNTTAYVCTQSLDLLLPIDMEHVHHIMQLCAESPAKPDIAISFEIRDTAYAQEMVLTAAVNDAKRKATALAKASNLRLGGIISINHDDIDSTSPIL